MPSHDISDFRVLPGLCTPSVELHDEWLIYVQTPLESIPSSVNIPDFWNSMQDQYPLLYAVANQVIWMPVASVDWFSQYKHILNDRRTSLSEENKLLMLYHNGDLEHRFS